MRVLIASCGSRGDFQPLLALALAVRARGHAVRMAATPTHRADAEHYQLEFHGVGQDIQAFIAAQQRGWDIRNSLGAVAKLNELLLGELEAQFERLPELARDVDLVVAGGAVIAPRSVAEHRGVPYRYIGYTPQILPSSHHTPFMVPISLGARPLNRLWWRLTGAFYDRLCLGRLNAHRERLALARIESSFPHLFDPSVTIVAADPELLPCPPDQACAQVGAFHLSDARHLPEGLEAFLAAGPPPVYVGFGSMPDNRPERTAALVSAALAGLGGRAVMSSGWSGLGRTLDRPDTFVVGPVSHERLFPRMSAVVHHGGAGTTAAAARAGVPQLVVPHAFDQFANAKAVERAGLGLMLPRARLTADRLRRALERIRADEAIAARARTTGERLRRRAAVDDAVALLERSAVRDANVA